MWGLGNLGGFVGAGLISARDLLPDWLSVPIGNCFLSVFWALVWAGQRSFAGQTIRWRIAVIVPGLVFVAFMWIPPFPPSMTYRMQLASSVLLGFFSLAALDGLRANRSEPVRMRSVLVVLYLMTFVPAIVRSVAAELQGAVPDLLATNVASGLSIMALVLLVIAINIGLLLLTRERLENQLARAAMLDPLTGTLNRSGFLTRAARAAEQCFRSSRTCSVMVMDLDEFKAVNDMFGHAAGDRLLAGFASVAQISLRGEDILARIGGEEFCALLPGTNEAQAAAIAERLRIDYAATSFANGDARLTGTVSIGVAELSDGAALEAAIERADRAMYEAKSRGRNRVIGGLGQRPHGGRHRADARSQYR